MSERTGKTVKTTIEGVTVHVLTDGRFEVERDGAVLGKVEQYVSSTSVKPGKVRASASKPVKRWMATPKFVTGAFKRSSMGLTSRNAAIAALCD